MSRTTQPSEIREMAKEAAKAYFLEDRPLNDSIVKIARERGLNPHQTARVAEVANSAVYQGLRKKAEANGGAMNFEFDLARPEVIQASLGFEKSAASAADSRFASHLLDYEKPLAGEDSFRKEAASTERVPFRDPAVSKRMEKRAMRKAASVKSNIEGAVRVHELAFDSKVSGLAKLASSFLQQGLPFEQLNAAVLSHAGDEGRDDAVFVMRKVATILKEKGRIGEPELMKCAAMEAEDHFISAALPPHAVVNGDSHFMKAFDTTVRAGRCLSDLRQDHRQINLGHRFDVETLEG